MQKQGSPILLVRLDRIGDLILSLPVDESLKRKGFIPQWWISEGLEFITSNALPPRQALTIKKDIGLTDFKALYLSVRRSKFSMAIVFHAPWWVSFLLFLARVPIRVGPKSQWYSFLFYNRAVRQRRSEAKNSELEYNFLLVEKALSYKNFDIGRQSLKLLAKKNYDLKKWGLYEKKYLIVHPGMAGSALNWPTHNYIALIDQAVRFQQVVITGTKSDENFLEEIRFHFSKHPKVIFLDSKLSGDELLYVLQNASAVVAPSTGVLHLAASTGVPTFGLYSPVRVQRPERWGPQGLNTNVFVPEVNCPGEFACLGDACPHYNCMELIRVSDVIAALSK